MFSKPNPFDETVAAATNENLTSENWELILGVCDKVSRSSPESPRDCIAAVAKRFSSRNANVQLYALALSEALVKNCDVTVHREISSRVFTSALSKLIHDRTTHESVRKRALEFIQMCSLEFSSDPSLGLMNEVYHSLRSEGIHFPNPQKPKKEYTQTEMDKQKEEEELQLALALSLSETENRSTYRPSTAASKAATSATDTPKPVQDAPKVSRVRALYDFAPTEQGELGFQKGDIIRVLESVYRDWWKGELRGQMGIFPVNYVEKIVDPSPADLMKEAQIEAEVLGEIQNVERLLDMLSRIDPQKDAFSENEQLQTLYNSTLAIRPKLVRLIEKYSVKKDELVALNEKFLHARSMYDRMLGTSLARYAVPGGSNQYAMPQQQPYGAHDGQAQSQQQQQQYPSQFQAQPYGAYPPQSQVPAQTQSPPPTQNSQPYGSYDSFPPPQQQQPLAQQQQPPFQQQPQSPLAQQTPPYGGYENQQPQLYLQQQQQQLQQHQPTTQGYPQQIPQAVQQQPQSPGQPMHQPAYGGAPAPGADTYQGYPPQPYTQGYPPQRSPAVHQQAPIQQAAYGYGVLSP